MTDDDHFSGMGVLVVGNAHVAATEGTWTGGGDNDFAGEAANEFLKAPCRKGWEVV